MPLLRKRKCCGCAQLIVPWYKQTLSSFTVGASDGSVKLWQVSQADADKPDSYALLAELCPIDHLAVSSVTITLCAKDGDGKRTLMVAAGKSAGTLFVWSSAPLANSTELKDAVGKGR